MLVSLKKIGFTLGVSALLATTVYADLAPDFMEKLQADTRPLEDRERDGARRPYQVLNLLGVNAGMTAIDVGAAAGWYTRVLSAAVGPAGKVIMQEGPRAMQQENGQAFKDIAASLGNVEVSFENLGDIGSNVADVAVTALNLHHADDARGTAALADLYKVLKPGGVAAVIDHVAGANTPANSHRMMASTAKAWAEAAGFTVTESDILHTTADDHSMSSVAPELGRDSDRFLLVVRKPL